jgi:hypothetical protein
LTPLREVSALIHAEVENLIDSGKLLVLGGENEMGIRLYDPDALLLSQLRELQVTCGESEVTVRLRNNRRTGKREPQAGFLAATRLQGGIAFQVRVKPGRVNVQAIVLRAEVSIGSRRIDRSKTNGPSVQRSGERSGGETAAEPAADHAPMLSLSVRRSV